MSAGAALMGGRLAAPNDLLWGEGAHAPSRSMTLPDSATALRATYEAALHCLKGNVVNVFQFPSPVLTEGAVYHGVWLECAPQEGLVYSEYDPAVGRANHDVFFQTQREDGYIHCSIKPTTMGAGQIQMVVPIAATALELYHQKIHASQFLEDAYKSCWRWDDWLVRYRNTRGTGLCEGFCTYDTGHDHSPRWAGVPSQCPQADARLAPRGVGVPRLCPDLSATVFGGRIALAKMARIMGRNDEADAWEEKAEHIRELIVARLYDPDVACFFDRDIDNKFVRVRGDALTRVLGEHVVDQSMFQEIYRKQIHNPNAFWAPYPLPSIALDDPAFVRPIPRNSWGGATQALTALRAPRWMEHYGKPADLTHMMKQWHIAMLRVPGFFAQQMDPLTGEFTVKDGGGYSPAALVLLDYTWRLYGVREQDGELEWNCRTPAAQGEAVFELRTAGGGARLVHAGGKSSLFLKGKNILTVEGTARIVSDRYGKPLRVVGTENEEVVCKLHYPNGSTGVLRVAPNAVVKTGSGVGHFQPVGQ